jgi:hypothetical protein
MRAGGLRKICARALAAAAVLLVGCAANSYAGIPLSQLAATAEQAELHAVAGRARSGEKGAKIERARRFEQRDGVPTDRGMADRLAASAGTRIGGRSTMYVPRSAGLVGPVKVGGGAPTRIGAATPPNASERLAPFVAQGAGIRTQFSGLPAEIIRDLIKYEYFNKKCLLDQPIAYRVEPVLYAHGSDLAPLPTRASRAIAFRVAEIAAIRLCFAQSALPERCQDHQAETITVAKLVLAKPGFSTLFGSMADLVTYCVERNPGAASRPRPHGAFADVEVSEGMASAPDVSLLDHILAPTEEAPNTSSRAELYEITMCQILGERSAYNFAQVPPLDSPGLDADPRDFGFSAADILICSRPDGTIGRLGRYGRGELGNAMRRKKY